MFFMPGMRRAPARYGGNFEKPWVEVFHWRISPALALGFFVLRVHKADGPMGRLGRLGGSAGTSNSRMVLRICICACQATCRLNVGSFSGDSFWRG